MRSALIAPPVPLGATLSDSGVMFAVYVGYDVKEVAVNLYDNAEPDSPYRTYRLEGSTPVPWAANTGRIHVGTFRDVSAWSLYNYSVSGPYDPRHGLRYSKKCLLDPYAKLVEPGDFSLKPSALKPEQYARPEMLAYRVPEGEADAPSDVDLVPSELSNHRFAPRAYVIDGRFDWQRDRPPRIKWADSLIYEVHLGAMTKLHPQVPPELRGTPLGIVCEPVLSHLQHLGVTAVELLPVAQAIPSSFWDYNPISFFAPTHKWSAFHDNPRKRLWEFKEMVRQLHAAGIEVILDVVFNHTGEGNHLGPHLCFKGLANGDYYKLCGNHDLGPYRRYLDEAGCGNTFNLGSPIALLCVLDALRYWVKEMHVDGFRFDLATILTENSHCKFLEAITTDPLLAEVKLIFEPWDPSGRYQLGHFQPPIRSWNDRYARDVRDFWSGHPDRLRFFTTRLAGSQDFFPGAEDNVGSINYITCHDGKTVFDSVSYVDKYNEANDEGNRDGCNHEICWNRGYEGWPTDDKRQRAKLRDKRVQDARNLMATLALSAGIPMIEAGTELLHSTKGNNNPYCQNNGLTWLRWNRWQSFTDFVAGVFALRASHPVLRWIQSALPEEANGDGIDHRTEEHVLWFNPDGEQMTHEQWHDPERRCIGVRLLERRQSEVSFAPDPSELVLLFNSGDRGVKFIFPPSNGRAIMWRRILDTTKRRDWFLPIVVPGEYHCRARSVYVFEALR